mgnify:CR=1 FL=1|tara:strand:+ start:1989 stop:3629 length:1641 start_codon:yes stop_codon:yes gene_type:complete
MYNPTSKMQSPAGLYDMVSSLPSQQQNPELQQLGEKQLAPTEAILYVKNQLDRLRAARQPPPPSTVMQDMLSQLQQAQMPQQQPPMQQGPPPQQGPMQQGLPSLPVQNVGQPQNYAGGGIVAFTEGGTPFGRFVDTEMDARRSRIAQDEVRNRLSRELVSRYQSHAAPEGMFAVQSDAQRQEAQDLMQRLPDMSVEEMQAVLASGPGALKLKDQSARQAGGAEYMRGMQKAIKQAPAPAPVAASTAAPSGRPSGLAALQEFTPTAERMAAPDKTQADYLKEVQDQYAGLGIGKALEERGKYLEGRGSKIEKDLADRARMSRAQAFFKMAEEGGKPRGTLLKGATAGLSQYAGDKQALADKKDALEERTKEMQFTLAQAQEQQKLGNIQAANALFKDAEKRKEDLADKATAFAQQRTMLREELDARADEGNLNRANNMGMARLELTEAGIRAAATLKRGEVLSPKDEIRLRLEIEKSDDVRDAYDAVDKVLMDKGRGVLNTPEGQRLRKQGRKEALDAIMRGYGLGVVGTSGIPETSMAVVNKYDPR